jgi:hypothetical protein
MAFSYLVQFIIPESSHRFRSSVLFVASALQFFLASALPVFSTSALADFRAIFVVAEEIWEVSVQPIKLSGKQV